MFSKEKLSDLAVLTRHLSFLLQSGHSVSDTLQKLKSISDNNATDSIDALENILGGKHANKLIDSQFKNTSLEMLFRFLPRILKNNSNLIDFFTNIEKQENWFYDNLAEVWQSIKNSLVYLTANLIVAAIMINTVAIFVLPKFMNAYSQADVQLPQLTQFIFESFEIFQYLFLIVVTVFIILSVLIHFYVERHMQRFFPVPHMWQFIPFLGSTIQQYNRFIFLYFSSMLMHCGMTGKQAMEETSDELDLPLPIINTKSSHVGNNEYETALNLSFKLGTLEHELDYQLNRHLHRLIADISSFKEKISIAGQLFVGLTVGTLVVALYLPIFKLGSV